MSELTAPTTPPTPPPAEAVAISGTFENLAVTAQRRPDGKLGPGWYLYATVGGVEWPIAFRGLGGLDDDLQELATPGFKEARAERYARESGQQRTEPGPGAT